MNTQAGNRCAAMTAVAGTVFIAAGAFWLSFTSLADLARRSGIGAGQAWAWPLIVDGIIVVATVAVVALAGTRTSWVSLGPADRRGQRVGDGQCDSRRHRSRCGCPQHPGWCRRRRPARRAPGHHPPDLILTRPPEPHATAEPPDAVLRVLPDVDDATSVELVLPDVLPSPAPAPDSGSEPAFIGDDPGLEPSADRREQAAALHELGWPNKQIGRQLDVHPSTVGRWLTAHTASPDDDSADETDTNDISAGLSDQAPIHEEKS